jgi:N-acetylmuramoyl-L-alanine amidase CwlA
MEAIMLLSEAFAKLNIIQDFIPSGRSNRPGTRITPTKITIHNTDNDSPGADAAAHAKYQKGPDARERQVSWHFTVDDNAVFQSLPTNERGLHAGTREGNKTSIGIEICMHPEMEVTAGYDRAALLAAVMAFQLGIPVPSSIKQHHDWSGKHCPRVLRDKPNGWRDFVAKIVSFRNSLQEVPARTIVFRHDEDEGVTASRAKSVRRTKAGPKRKSSAKTKTGPRRGAKRPRKTRGRSRKK